MALDGAFLLAVKQELQPLVGGRIEKVYQPSKEEAVIAIRTRTGSSRVLICAGANSARILRNICPRILDAITMSSPV